MTKPDVPMYVVTRCMDILSGFAQNGEGVHAELCKHPLLPASLVSFIERVCDEPEAQFAHNTKMLVEDLIKFLCTIVMKACSSGKLKPPGSSDPKHLHAQAIRSMCIRLVARFKPHPVVSAAHAKRVGGGDVGGAAVAGGSAPAAEASLATTPGNTTRFWQSIVLITFVVVLSHALRSNGVGAPVGRRLSHLKRRSVSCGRLPQFFQ